MKDFRQKMLDTIRSKNVMNKVFDLVNANPNKEYCLVRVDEDFDPYGTNLDSYITDGWEPEVDTNPVIDNRASAPDNDKDEYLRAKPITKRGRGKAEFVLMSIDKEKNLKNEKDRAQRTLERFRASSTGRKVVKKGSELHITDSEVNESNMNKNSDEV